MSSRSRGRQRGRGALGGGYGGFTPPQSSELLQWVEEEFYDAGDGANLLRADDRSGNGNYILHNTSTDLYNLNSLADADLIAAGVANEWLTKVQVGELMSFYDTLRYITHEGIAEMHSYIYALGTVLTEGEQVIMLPRASRLVQYLEGVVQSLLGIVQFLTEV